MTFLIGKFKNMPIYLNGDDHKDLNSVTLSVPWCMPSYRKGSAEHRKMVAFTPSAHEDGETVHVGFWDVVTSVSRSDFKVELQLSGDTPQDHDKLVLTFPFIKANPSYIGQEDVALRRCISDHEATVAKQQVGQNAMGPKVTSHARLEQFKNQHLTISSPSNRIDKDVMKFASHLLR